MREVFHEVERLSLFFTHARAFRLSYSSLNKKHGCQFVFPTLLVQAEYGFHTPFPPFSRLWHTVAVGLSV